VIEGKLFGLSVLVISLLTLSLRKVAVEKLKSVFLKGAIRHTGSFEVTSASFLKLCTVFGGNRRVICFANYLLKKGGLVYCQDALFLWGVIC